MAKVLEKKFRKYMNKAENENFSLLIHDLSKYANTQIGLKKMSLGVEEVE